MNLTIPNIIKAVKEVYKDNLVLAKLAATQAVLESNLLKKPSKLALANNLFGIKGEGTAGSVIMPTTEYINNKYIKVDQKFAANNSIEDSINQHKVLMSKTRYKDVVLAKTLREACDAVYKAGYATDPDYSTKLFTLYSTYLKHLFIEEV